MLLYFICKYNIKTGKVEKVEKNDRFLSVLLIKNVNKTVYTRFQISECKKQVFRSMFTKIYYLLLTTLEIMTTYSVHTASAREEKGSVSRGAHILKSKIITS